MNVGEKATSSRYRWMDSARGFAIVMVVLGHACAVPILKGVPADPILLPMTDAFTLFRMPLLLFLSGCLLPRSLAKSGRVFFYGKWSHILWPYLVWATVRYLPDIRSIPPWDPEVWWAAGYLWFLMYLMIYYVVAWGMKYMRMPYWSGAAIGFALAFVPLDGLAHIGSAAVFFFLGAEMWSRAEGLRLVRKPLVWAPASLVAVSGVLMSIMFGTESIPALRVIVSLAGVVALISLFQSIGDRASWLEYIGRNSLVFYVTHFPIISAGTAVLAIISPEMQDWYWLVLFIAAMAGCYVLTSLQHYTPVKWLYAAPTFGNSSRSRVSKSL